MPNYNAPGERELNDFCLQRLLVDGWLAQPPEQQGQGGFTRHARNTGAASRIDRIYISAAASDDISSVKVIPQPDLTDHDGVQLTLRTRGKNQKTKTWRLNLGMLDNQRFLTLLHIVWEVHLHFYPPDEDLARCWLNYKHKVKRLAVTWQTKRAAERRQAVRELQQ
jgi:hypothetical protein